MKTSYEILLIDDDLESVDTDREDVSDFLETFGIKSNIVPVEAPADGSVRDLIVGLLANPELDLLMVDYHMDGLPGDELVKLIRNSDHIYLPVIFYSSSPVSDILDAVRASELDGVYVTNRKFLVEKFKEVVRSLLNKEHTTKRTRGLLMEGVSEIDATLNKLFQSAWTASGEEVKEKIMKYLLDIVKDRAKSTNRALASFPAEIGEFSEHVKESFFSTTYDTNTRWRVVQKILNLLEHDEKQVNTLKEFGQDSGGVPSLNKLRNIYAHSTREALQSDHSELKCISVRRTLRKQNENIESIISAYPLVEL